MKHLLIDAFDPGVDKLASLYSRLVDAGMGNHIWIGVVDDDKVIEVTFDSAKQSNSLFFAAHLGHKIIGSYSRTRGDFNVFAGEWQLPLTVEIISDKPFLFGLGEFELTPALECDNTGERHLDKFGRERDLYWEIFGVLGHGDKAEII